jgi:hypothetical protein
MKKWSNSDIVKIHPFYIKLQPAKYKGYNSNNSITQMMEALSIQIMEQYMGFINQCESKANRTASQVQH